MDTPNYFAIIPASVRYDKNLCSGAKLLYGEITSLTHATGYCWASNQYFAELYDVDISTIKRWLKSLSDFEYIEIDTKKLGLKWDRRIYLKDFFRRGMDVPSTKNEPFSEEEIIQENCIQDVDSEEDEGYDLKKCLRRGENDLSKAQKRPHNSKLNNKKDKNNNALYENDPETTEPDEWPSAVVVFSFLKKIELSTQQYLALMKEFSEEELMKAVDLYLESIKTQEINNPYGWLKSCAKEKYQKSPTLEDRLLKNSRLATEIREKYSVIASHKGIIVEALHKYLEIYSKDSPARGTIIEYKDPNFKDKLKEALCKWELLEEV